MAYVLVKSKGKNTKNEGYKCSLKRTQIEYLALNAYRNVLARRQTKYGKVISWLDERLLIMKVKDGESCAKMKGIVASNVG